MQTYHPTKVRPIVGIIARIVSENPGIIEDPDRLMSEIGQRIPDFHNKERCINCGASMAEYVFQLDILDALLLLSMAQVVKANLINGLHFTDANKVRVQQILNVSYAIKSRTTQCSKLGLIAKLDGKNGKQVPGTWVITSRGFAALKGEPVPKSVVVFRSKILERTEEMVTLAEVFDGYSAKMRDKIRRGKNPKQDWRSDFENYDRAEWVHVAGMHQGELF